MRLAQHLSLRLHFQEDEIVRHIIYDALGGARII